MPFLLFRCQVKLALPVLEYRPWSPSKADLALRCPRAFKYRYVDHIKSEYKGSAAKVGTTAHKAQELVIEGSGVKEAFDKALEEFQHELTSTEVEQVSSFAVAVETFNEYLRRFKVKHKVVEVHAEKPWAINTKFEPCDYSDKEALIRGIVDLVLLLESGQVVIIDHKSGRKKPVDNYATQLDTYAVLALAHYPQATAVQCAIHFMAHEKVEWYVLRKRTDIVSLLQPWLVDTLNKRANGLEGFRPIVKRWTCGWCDFRKVCPEGNSNDGQREGDRDSEEGSLGASK